MMAPVITADSGRHALQSFRDMRTLCEQPSTEEPWHVCKKTALQFDIHVAGCGEGSEHGAVYVARITHSCINTNIVTTTHLAAMLSPVFGCRVT